MEAFCVSVVLSAEIDVSITIGTYSSVSGVLRKREI
jgi:hypothetical protein